MNTPVSIWYDQEGDFLEIGLGTPAHTYGEHLRPDIIIHHDTKTDEIKLISFLDITHLPRNIIFPLPSLHICYDKRKDVLDLSFGPVDSARLVKVKKDIFQRVDIATGEPRGLTIQHLTKGSHKFVDEDIIIPSRLLQATAVATA